LLNLDKNLKLQRIRHSKLLVQAHTLKMNMTGYLTKESPLVIPLSSRLYVAQSFE